MRLYWLSYLIVLKLLFFGCIFSVVKVVLMLWYKFWRIILMCWLLNCIWKLFLWLSVLFCFGRVRVLWKRCVFYFLRMCSGMLIVDCFGRSGFNLSLISFLLVKWLYYIMSVLSMCLMSCVVEVGWWVLLNVSWVSIILSIWYKREVRMLWWYILRWIVRFLGKF